MVPAPMPSLVGKKKAAHMKDSCGHTVLEETRHRCFSMIASNLFSTRSLVSFKKQVHLCHMLWLLTIHCLLLLACAAWGLRHGLNTEVSSCQGLVIREEQCGKTRPGRLEWEVA